MDEEFFFGADHHRPGTYSIRSSTTSSSNGSSGGSTGGESDTAASPHSTTASLVDFSVLDRPSSDSLKLELAHIELGLSATTSRESLLDELLGDIRRSCGTSVTSTPTAVSMSEGEHDSNVFECRLRRSEAELRTLGVSELKRISETLQSEVDCVSSLLVRLLHVKDKRATRASKQCDRLSAILKDLLTHDKLLGCFVMTRKTAAT